MNQRVSKATRAEIAVLKPLPLRKTSEYKELPARVSKYALFTVRKALYSAPSQLIGHRILGPWFICPRNGCGRRAALLYWGSGFACRQCLALAYESQTEQPLDRLSRRVAKYRARLVVRDGMPDQKPARMHERTYFGLLDTIANAAERGSLFLCLP
jgi:hypothetical protein